MLVAEIWGLPCHMCLCEWEGSDEQLRKMYFTPRKHLYLLFSERNALLIRVNIQICRLMNWKEHLVIFILETVPLKPTVQVFLSGTFLTDLI